MSDEIALKPVWTIADLPPLKTGYLTAFKTAEGYQQYIGQSFGFETWHWGVVGHPHPADMFSGPDYSHGESINKGVARTLLSEQQYRHMRIYGPDMPDEEIDRLGPSLLKRMDFYGKAGYDWLGVCNVGLWFILKHFGIKWWMQKDARFYCIEFVNQLYVDFDFPLVDGAEPSTPMNMEQSDQLKLVWGTF